jgi:hypothetical protein
MKAIVVTPDTIEFRFITDLHATLGGYLEALSVGENFICFIDEDGKAKGLRPNQRATDIIQLMLAKRDRTMLPGDVIAGKAIFVGVDGEDEGDIPREVVEEYFSDMLDFWLAVEQRVSDAAKPRGLPHA